MRLAVRLFLLASAVALGAASCLIQLTMNWAQREVSPTRATIIYAGEPVWAGIVGRLAGDRLPVLAIVGAVFIVAGAVVSELNPRRRPKRGDPDGDAAIAEAGADERLGDPLDRQPSASSVSRPRGASGPGDAPVRRRPVPRPPPSWLTRRRL